MQRSRDTEPHSAVPLLGEERELRKAGRIE